MLIKYNSNLQRNNSFRVNSKAPIWLEVTQLSDLEQLGEVLSSENRFSADLNFTILGEGTNCLFVDTADRAFVKQSMLGVNVVDETQDHIYVEVAAGENWDKLVEFAVASNWGGLENLSYIPGSVGAAPVQNIGAYGVEVGERIDYVRGYCLESGSHNRLNKLDCNFGYRESVFKRRLKNQFIITHVCLRLDKKFTPITTYSGVSEELSQLGVTQFSAQELRRAIINIRKRKLPDPLYEPNAGSFFKNPIVDTNHFKRIKKRYPKVPSYSLESGEKIPAAWLIEATKLKGFIANSCRISEKQPLVLVNHMQADGAEILKLAQHVQTKVFNEFEIKLEFEVNIINKDIQ